MTSTAPPSNVINLETDDDFRVEAAAASARKEAFRGGLAWRGMPLIWTPSRAALFDFLRIPPPVLAADTLAAIKAAREAAGTDEESELQDQANRLYNRDSGGGSGHVINAQIILWLAAHQPKDWRGIRHDRAKLLETIDEWIDQHVGLDDTEQLAAITNKLLTAAEATQAIPQPRPEAEGQAGN